MAANSGFRWELYPLLCADSCTNISSLLEAKNSGITFMMVNSANSGHLIREEKYF